MGKILVVVNLYCKDFENKAFDYEYTEVIDTEKLNDEHGQFDHIFSGAVDRAVSKVENENQNCNVDVIHAYKIKGGEKI